MGLHLTFSGLILQEVGLCVLMSTTKFTDSSVAGTIVCFILEKQWHPWGFPYLPYTGGIEWNWLHGFLESDGYTENFQDLEWLGIIQTLFLHNKVQDYVKERWQT